MSQSPFLKFPKDFLWGAATSSHQVEGNNENNWTKWEAEHAAELARGSKKSFDTPAVHWRRIRSQAIDPANYISGRAVDHYRRFTDDFKLAHELNHNAHRFSIEWSRIEPHRGEINQTELAHYRKVIKTLRSLHIEPLVTLFHFTLPTWVEAQGGFTNPKTIKDFANYAAIVAQYLGDDVTYWCTINEPEILASFSYTTGYWPPQGHSLLKGVRAYHDILPRAHIAAYKAIKRHHPDSKIGISKNNIWYVGTGGIVSPVASRVWWWWANHRFLDRIKKYSDYIGLNYYFKVNVHGFHAEIDQYNPSELGWGLHPEGLYVTLSDLGKRYKQPIIVTEAGVADSTDESRAWYIKELLRHTHQAISEGVDVRGFLYWSLLDNFEWDKGFWPKFGLIEVDRKTMRRKIRPSAREYARIIKAGGLD